MPQLPQGLASSSKVSRSHDVPYDIRELLHQAVDNGHILLEWEVMDDMASFTRRVVLKIQPTCQCIQTNLMGSSIMKQDEEIYARNSMIESLKRLHPDAANDKNLQAAWLIEKERIHRESARQEQELRLQAARAEEQRKINAGINLEAALKALEKELNK